MAGKQSVLPPDLSDLDPLNDPLFRDSLPSNGHSAARGPSSSASGRNPNGNVSTANGSSIINAPARPASTDPLSLLMQLEQPPADALQHTHAARQAIHAHDERRQHILDDLHSQPFAGKAQPMPLPRRRPSYSGRDYSPPRRLSGIMGQSAHSFSLDPSLSSPPLEPFHPASPTHSSMAVNSLEYESKKARRSSSADEWSEFQSSHAQPALHEHRILKGWPSPPQRAHSFPFGPTHEEPKVIDNATAVLEALLPISLYGTRPGMIQILDEDIADGLRPSLPPRIRPLHRWKLIYSLDAHGTSFTTLYERMKHAYDGEGPILLVVKDTEGNRFGAYANERLHRSESYYGDNTCFLWSALPRPPGPQLGPVIRTWKSTHRNSYYILSDNASVSFGGGDGQQGLWIDNKLEKGYTGRSITFGNDPLGVEHADKGRSFDILAVEAWAVA